MIPDAMDPRDLYLPNAWGRAGFVRHSARFEPIGRFVEGRAVAITGGSTGIGFAAGQALAAAGARVTVISKDPVRNSAAARAISDAGGAARGVVADLGDPTSLAPLVDALEPPDVLIHNAAVGGDAPDEVIPGLDRLVLVNLLAPWWLTRALAPRMAPGSRVVFVTSGGAYTRRFSTAALTPRRYDGLTLYADTKRALLVASRALSAEFPHLSCSVTHPGWVDTPIVRANLPRFHRALGRTLRAPEQGADTLVWLAAADRAMTGFWFDRAPAPEHVVPLTRDPPGAMAALTAWCSQWCQRLALPNPS